MFEQYTAVLYLILLIATYVLASIDWSRTRVLTKFPPISVIIPCYNDGTTVEATVESLFASYDAKLIDLIIVNDKSKDESLRVIRAFAKKYPKNSVRVVDNKVNLGKAESINKVLSMTRHDILFVIDADMQITHRALADVLFRLSKEKVGAVSCPYMPADKGFFAKMQTLEYQMLSLTQGAYNSVSTLALWGGFIGARKVALKEAGLFSANMLTEDLDMAFKLNEKGWRVQQSFVPVKTHVPLQFRVWFKQKVRWAAGAVQCYIKHPRVWTKKPLQMLFLISFFLLITSFASKLIADILYIDNIYTYLVELIRAVGVADGLAYAWLIYGAIILKDVFWKFAFTMLSLPYTFAILHKFSDWTKVLLIVPFSIIYMPFFIIASTYGFVVAVWNYRALAKAKRSW